MLSECGTCTSEGSQERPDCMAAKGVLWGRPGVDLSCCVRSENKRPRRRESNTPKNLMSRVHPSLAVLVDHEGQWGATRASLQQANQQALFSGRLSFMLQSIHSTDLKDDITKDAWLADGLSRLQGCASWAKGRMQVPHRFRLMDMRACTETVSLCVANKSDTRYSESARPYKHPGLVACHAVRRLPAQRISGLVCDRGAPGD